MNTRPATLRPGSRSGEMRHYLSGRPVNGGDTIELCFSGGWFTGRYEWNSEQQPSFHCSIVVDGGGVVERVIEIPENALVRWPCPSSRSPPGLLSLRGRVRLSGGASYHRYPCPTDASLRDAKSWRDLVASRAALVACPSRLGFDVEPLALGAAMSASQAQRGAHAGTGITPVLSQTRVVVYGTLLAGEPTTAPCGSESPVRGRSEDEAPVRVARPRRVPGHGGRRRAGDRGRGLLRWTSPRSRRSIGSRGTRASTGGHASSSRTVSAPRVLALSRPGRRPSDHRLGELASAPGSPGTRRAGTRMDGKAEGPEGVEAMRIGMRDGRVFDGSPVDIVRAMQSLAWGVEKLPLPE